MSTKSICLFNHKGGVSKTTTTFNLGWSLARLGHKVLMVDLDSQANLTGLVMGYSAIDDDKMGTFYSSRANLTLQPIVDALINGVAPADFLKTDSGQVLDTGHENLKLLPGHLDIADLDSQISVSLKIATGIPATRNIPGNLPAILQEIAKKKYRIHTNQISLWKNRQYRIYRRSLKDQIRKPRARSKPKISMMRR